MSVHPSPELRFLFEAALNEFESRTGTNLVQHQIFDELVACESIESILNILQEQAKPLRTALGNDNTLMKWIKRTVTVLHFLSTNSMIVDSVSSAFPPARAVFAGIAILLSAINVKDVDKSHGTLVDLFESFELVLRRLDIYTKIPSTPAMTEIIVKILTELLYTISLAIQQIKQGRFKKIGKKLLGQKDHEVEAILQRLDRLTLEEARMTGTTTLEVVYDILKNMTMVMDDRSVLMDDIHRTLVDIQQVASDMNKSKRDELQEKVRRWLSSPDPSVNHNIARNTHHEGSAKWFINGNTFKGWKMGTGSLIWVNGKPGSGKSILSSSIIEDITKSCKAGLASIAFFYFDFKDESKKNARGALSSLLVQLAAQSDAYSEILSALYSDYNAGTKQPSEDALRQSLESMLAIPDQPPIYIVIDALDECPNSVDTPSPREKVLSLVEWLVELRHSNLWVSATSRPEPDIATVLEPLASRVISLHAQAGQNEDITNYIKWFVTSDPKAKRWRKQEQELVIEKLSERAEGMFRWVFCQLDRLRRCIVSGVRHALDELPETLDDTYERTLLDIDKENWAYAHRLFQCLVVACRPLRVEELAEFLAFKFDDEGSPIFQADRRPEDPRDAVLSTCSSLISVVDDNYGRTIVQFSHFSVKEYLTSTRIAEGRVQQYYIPLEPAHFLVTRACLSLLLRRDDQKLEDSERTENWEDSKDRERRDFPLLLYAAKYWVEHAKFGSSLSHSQTEDMAKQLFDPKGPNFAAWVSIYDTDEDVSSWSLRGTPLYYAALLDLRGVAEWLVSTRFQNINASGGAHGTPLHAAFRTGSLEVVQFLLMCHADGNCGANINAINHSGETPLTVALKYGPIKTLMTVTNLLLGHGANPNAALGRNSSIYTALSRSHRDVAHLLHRHGANPNSRDDDGETLLHLALEVEDLEVAQGLLDLGADVNSRDNHGRTPLHEIQSRSEGVGLLLLGRGADPGIRDNAGQTPLHVASRNDSLKIAQQLLKLGADVNSRDIEGRTPLHVIQSRSEGVGLLLLERGADPGIRDDAGQTPLHVASRNDSLKIAQQLLKLGADVNSRDNEGRTPLHVIHWTHEGVGLLLLERGADPGIRDNAGQTPLHVVSRSGSLKIAQHLLKLGADVNSRDNQGRTPLHVIDVIWWSEDVFLLLLEHGADTGIRDDAGQTPLHAASRSGNLKIAQHLLKLGADVNSRDDQGRTPLHVIRWSEDVFLLLLLCGANPGIRDDAGQTPLHAASRSGSLKIAQHLLKLGADVNSRDNEGRTPLHVIHWTDEGVGLLLLERGADPGIRDDAGQTPLHVASRNDSLEIAEQLLKFGADVNSRDNQGRTPLQIAVERRHDGVAKLLLSHGAELPSSESKQSDGAENPSSESTHTGNAEMLNPESTQSGVAEMPSSESRPSGDAEMPSSKQSGDAARRTTGWETALPLWCKGMLLVVCFFVLFLSIGIQSRYEIYSTMRT